MLFFFPTAKVIVVVYRTDIHDYACSTDFPFPLAKVGANAAWNYWSNLGSVHWVTSVEYKALPDTSTHDQCSESNPRSSDLSPKPYPLDIMQ